MDRRPNLKMGDLWQCHFGIHEELSCELPLFIKTPQPRRISWRGSRIYDFSKIVEVEGESVRQGEPGNSCPVRFQRYLIDYSWLLPRSSNDFSLRTSKKVKEDEILQHNKTLGLNEDNGNDGLRWMRRLDGPKSALHCRFFQLSWNWGVKSMSLCGTPGFEFRTWCSGWRYVG